MRLYNTQKEITTHIAKFLQNSIPNIRKTQLKIIPFIIFGMINFNSCVASSIASNLKDDFSLVKLDNLEKINNSTLKSFTSMFSLVCFSITWLVMIGSDFSKNSVSYNRLGLKTHKNGKRIMSLFKIGMTLFKRAFNSPVYIRIPFNFILYDC